MCSGHLTEELTPHLARPHEPCAEPIDPEPKRLIEGGDREADMVSALNLNVYVVRHTSRLTGKRDARL